MLTDSSLRRQHKKYHFSLIAQRIKAGCWRVQNKAGAGAVGSLSIVFWGFLMMAAFPAFDWLGGVT